MFILHHHLVYYFKGWGTTELSGATPNVLQKVEVSVINLSKCKKSYPKINEHQLCTLTPGKDACQVNISNVIGRGTDFFIYSIV